MRPAESGVVTRIRPGARPVSAAFAEAWAGRELLYFLMWRDMKVRYKHTVLGVGWALVQPFLMMVAFTVVFGRLAGLGSDGEPYPAFTAAALVPWTYFAAAVNEGANALLLNQHLLGKVYFPRLILPLAAVVKPGIDAAIGLVLLAGLMVWYGIPPGPGLVWVPACALLAVAAAGVSAFWLSALSIRYRDVRHVLPFAIQLGWVATPIVYSTTAVPERWHVLWALNPMVTVVEGFRHALLGTPAPSTAMAAVSATVVAVGLAVSVRYFRRVEGTLVDLA